MAFRGRGRGRGYGGAGGYGFAKQEPFELFPDIELPNIKSVHKEETLVRESVKLQNFWKASAYYLDETVSKNSRSTEIERYSDMKKPTTTIARDSLSQILELKRFPQELIGGVYLSNELKMGGDLLRLFASICLVILYYVFHDASMDLSHGTMKSPGSKGQRPSQKKVRWNPESGLMG